MNVVAVVSMKGGVGKTSTTANLAAGLVRLGRRVAVVDLDPQNSLFLHFGLDARLTEGVALAGVQGRSWQEVGQRSASGVMCFPFGALSVAQIEHFERGLEANPAWIGEQLAAFGKDGDDTVVLIDTPPGPSIYLRAAFECADLALLVLLADAGSFATIPAMETWVDEWRHERPDLVTRYLINQLDQSSPLSRDIAEVVRQRLEGRLAPAGVHRDEAVGEALAMQQSVLTYDPHSQAAHDYQRLASWLSSALP